MRFGRQTPPPPPSHSPPPSPSSVPVPQTHENVYTMDLVAGGIQQIFKKFVDNGLTVLMAIAMYSRNFTKETLETCIKLAVKGNHLNATDNDKWTSLHYAVRFSNESGSVETVKALIEAGAKLDERECKDCTPLMSAIMVCETMSSLETVEVLINAGSSLNLKTKTGYNALDSLRYEDTRTAIIQMIKKRVDANSITNQRGG
jgi:hypothetical protein